MQGIIDYIEGLILDIESAIMPDFVGKGIVAGIIGSILLLILLFVAVKLVRYIFRRLEKYLLSWKGAKFRSFRFRGQEIFTKEQVGDIISKLFKLVRIAINLFITVLILNVIFSFFEFTSGIADFFFGELLDALELTYTASVGYIPNLLILILLYFITRFVLRIVNWIFQSIEVGRLRFRNFDPEWAKPTLFIVRVLIVVMALLLAYPYLPGSGSSAFQTVSIFVGALFSLGSTAAVANMVSGLVLTYMGAFKVGDRVKIADALGDVVEKTTFTTRIRTVKNVVISIPNGMVLSNHIINYSLLSQKKGLVLHTSVTIGYDVPWQKIHELLIAAAEGVEDVEKEPEPFVLQKGLNDFYVEYELNVFTRTPQKMLQIMSELHRNIQESFHKNNVEIASPHLSAIRDGNAVNIPDEYLPKDYKPAAFRIWPYNKMGKGGGSEE